MIYFTIPSSSGLVSENTNIYLDRSPTESSNLSLIRYEAETGLSQVDNNGINIQEIKGVLTKKSIPTAEAIIINSYLRALGTSDLVVIFPEGSKKYNVVSWSVIIKNLLYADVTINVELMYL